MKYLFIVVQLLLTTGSMAQLKVGDPFPDPNYLSPDKLVIVNFWATWCKPCLKEMKFLDSMVREHRTKFKVVSVTYQDSATVNKFVRLNGNPYPDLTIVTGETTLNKLFPHKTIPHNVWVKEGSILAITGPDEVSAEKILSLINGARPKMINKQDDMKFRFDKPYQVPDSLIKYRSLLSPNNPSISSGAFYGADTLGMGKRFFAWNRSLINIIWLAFSRQRYGRINWDLVDLRVKDSVKYILPVLQKERFSRSRYAKIGSYAQQEKQWKMENLYCYELSFSEKTSMDKISRYMYQDMERNFPIRVFEEQQLVRCIAVKVEKKAKRLLVASTAKKHILMIESQQVIIQNLKIAQLLEQLFDKLGGPLMVDQTEIDFPIDLILNFSSGEKITVETIVEKLKIIGFIFKPAKLNLTKLVIEELR